jgi:hypothetical protein
MKRKSKGPITAAELMAELQSDPEWVRQNAERERAHAASVAKLQAEIKPEHDALLADLNAAGVRLPMGWVKQISLPPEERPGDKLFPVKSIYDLVNTSASYPEAIPILIRHLERVRHPVMRSGIIRSLAVKESRGEGGRVLLNELKSGKDAKGSELRGLIALALTVAADKSMLDELIALANDPDYDDVKWELEKTIRRWSRKRKPKKTDE